MSRRSESVGYAIAAGRYARHLQGQTLDDHAVLASVGSVGDAYANALAESRR